VTKVKIKDVQSIPVVLIKDDPEWKNALAASPTLGGIVLKIYTDKNIVGVGYAGADAPYKGVRSHILEAVLHEYRQYLIGKDPFNREKILDEIDQIPLSDIPVGEPFDGFRARVVAKSPIDVALHDIVAKSAGLPLYQLLGGLVREEIPVLRILAIKEPKEMAENAVRLAKQGYKYIKIKVEGVPDKDIERVRAIRDSVGPQIHLTIDANQSYSPEGAIEVIQQVEKYSIEIVEQPVAAEDFEGLAEVNRQVNCLVEAHESADSPESIFRLVKDKVVGCISVPVAEGGLLEARRAIDICRLGDVKCLVACVGSRILSAACMHLVASTSNIHYACQIAEFPRFINDPATGLEVDNGVLRVPSAPGLGIEVNI